MGSCPPKPQRTRMPFLEAIAASVAMAALLAAGIDGWHGIQRNIGMDMAKLKDRYGRRLCLFGGVNAETLINGSPHTVREEVRTAIAEAGTGGGLVLTCSNVVAAGARLDLYQSMRQACRDYGSYPLLHDASPGD